jgi:putative heme-binding domain-containing protein
MLRRCFLVGFAVLSLLAGAYGTRPARAESTSAVQWIWFDEGDPAREAPAETRYFRKVFTIDRPVQKVVDEGTLDITADDAFRVWVNGTEIGSGDRWQRVYQFDVMKQLVHGKNVVAVEAKNNHPSPAGLLVRLAYVPNGMSKLAMVSDGSWKASKTAPAGWQQVGFDDGAWSRVRVLGPVGQAGPWKNLVWDAGSVDDRFTVPAGFKVEMVVPPTPRSEHLDRKLPFSLINMTFDAKGRLLLSQERGPVLVCTEPNDKGVFQSLRPYCKQVKGCQGMCWVKDALLLVGDGPRGAGLYRCRDTKGADEIDEVQLLHRFKGGMGEHGPHAILHGPDNWLYVVTGNHAWATPEKLAPNSPLMRWPNGQMGPDQGRIDTTEDVLLPRLNDSRGHAANILAPGGTIWRLDHEGKNMSLVAAGFRNHFDAAFSPTGELFTFDSDMEWDEGLPWYRAVRVCHCPPGADFVWRTGAANTPGYYIDSLPPVLETGRGSPVGLEFYDHYAFPEKYRGAFFMADWSLGIIYAVHLKRDGATYKGEAEKFCTGAPMNVTDIVVGPDGALYFALGGRGTQGGVYRVTYPGKSDIATRATTGGIPMPPQPLAAWSRARSAEELAKSADKQWEPALIRIVRETSRPASVRIQALNYLQLHQAHLDPSLLLALLADKSPEVRAQAVWLLGVHGYKEGQDALIEALEDKDALVRRRACEALIRTGVEPPVDAIWPLLSQSDRFVRTAARLVLQRIDPKKWTDRLWQEEKHHIILEGIVALCKTNQAAPYAEQIFEALHHDSVSEDVQANLDYLRTVQLALIHTKDRPGSVRGIAVDCWEHFPQEDWRVNRELAILLPQLHRDGVLEEPVHEKLLAALLASKNDRQQQIHYFYCLRFLYTGWTPQQKDQLLAWYDSTRDWTGGHSFTPFLENILREINPIFSGEDRARVVQRGDQFPLAAAAMLRMAQAGQLPPAPVLADLYARVSAGTPHGKELKDAVVESIGRSQGPDVQVALRHIADKDPGQRDLVVRGLARFPTAENWPYLIRGLESPNALVVLDAIEALRKVPTKPKAEDAAPYRAVLLSTGRLFDKNRWQVVELLRHWSGGRNFGADDGDWKAELASWSRWYAQAFPKEPALPNVAGDKPAESKYKFEELLTFLEKDPVGRQGDVARGRAVFEKGQCLKCHKYGREGEGIGPDLTTLSKRFKRVDILESIVYPSKVISDQYRAVAIVTKKGQQINGLAAPQGDTVTVLQSDGTKVVLRKDEIDQQFASLVSVMPEKLLDPLTLQEIADLFAFLESEPK